MLMRRTGEVASRAKTNQVDLNLVDACGYTPYYWSTTRDSYAEKTKFLAALPGCDIKKKPTQKWDFTTYEM